MAKSKKTNLAKTTAVPAEADATATGGGAGGGGGKHLVIVESPTKAKTINKYLGSGYKVMASVGHVRDLPARAPKGSKQPVPGVDIEHQFKPTYEVLPAKRKTVADLKKAAKGAADVWFATDLDREGEAIAWHLAQALDVEPAKAQRVVFNAITKTEIQNAFAHPRPIDENRVNAQQARRILDRIVGYQVSPLLWKKVAGGLSAGRVQSVAVRLVVDREREIEAFMPEEFWKVAGYFTVDTDKAGQLAAAWKNFLNEVNPTHRPAIDQILDDGTEGAGAEGAGAAESGPKGLGVENARKVRSVREKLAWLSDHRAMKAELVEFDGQAPDIRDRDAAVKVATALGFAFDHADEWQDPKGKGPAKFLCVLQGGISGGGGVTGGPSYRIQSIQTKRTTTRPSAPFITSTLQQAAANQLGFALQRTMRIAQQLYEGIDLGGDLGQVGLITYMRTDSTHLSGEALSMVRSYITQNLGDQYLPEKPNFFTSSNKDAQEAHEAIRPTDVAIAPRRIKGRLTEEQYKLYDLIWRRFVSCQMTAAQWDSTTVMIEAEGRRMKDEGRGTMDEGRKTQADESARPSSIVPRPSALFKATGRTLVFDGFYKVMGLPTYSDEALLPPLCANQPVAAIQVDPTQSFTSPPPRFTEASLQKKLEEEGIGRPSTYAAIIQTIQDRKYVQGVAPGDRRLMATDMGKVVSDKLVEAFPEIMDVAYTRQMEAQLDKIEDDHLDWVQMLEQFYGPFKERLDLAHESMTHAKAQTEPAPFKCPKCGAATVYRFGKNGRFLSCSAYPDCKYASPIDSEGNPAGAELTDIACPLCGSGMTKRNGRFGPFLGCENYPACKGILKLDRRKGTLSAPKPPPMTTDLPCPKCQSPLNLRRSKRGPWLSCSKYPKCRGRLAWSAVDEKKQKELDKALAAHETANPVPVVKTRDGKIIGDGYMPQVVGSSSSAPLPANDPPA